MPTAHTHTHAAMGRPAVLALLLLTAVAAASASGSHSVLTFDYGWRFHLGDPAQPGPPPPSPPTPPPTNCSFPVPAGGFAYDGLFSQRAARTGPACAAACCALGASACWTWQFSQTQGCWLGFPSVAKRNESGWSGGARAGTPPPDPPPPPPGPVGPTPLAMPVNPAAASFAYDDSKWRRLDLPHDYIVEQAYDPSVPGDQGPGSRPGGAGQSYLPRDVAYYRKHFSLPASWAQNTVWIYFEGVFRATRIWLNGVAIRDHAAYVGDAHGEGGGAGMGGGYTSFSVRLDNCSAVRFGESNVLTVYVDPRMGSGWFYEGGGIYRKTYLHSALPVHIVTDGVQVVGRTGACDFVAGAQPASGVRTGCASVEMSVELVNMLASSQHVAVFFTLFDAAGYAIGSAAPPSSVIVPAASNSSWPGVASSGTYWINLTPDNAPPVELWSVSRPYLYTLVVTVRSTSGVDSLNTSFGIYNTTWTGDRGFFMNDQHVKIRGFCNHESFGGVGMAIPDRINLFRAQALRSVGANGWRMSHNPVSPGLYDILDRVGVVAMDETRILGTDAVSIENMGAMVRRDRNHPSVVIWSYCNEGGCGKGGASFRNITHKYDMSRPTLGNRENFDDANTDVEGFSHKQGSVFDAYNALNPMRPKFASECCSCSSQRDSTAGADNGGLSALSCSASQSNASNSRDFMAGTMVWTLFDYYGESHGWPSVSSSYGQVGAAAHLCMSQP